MNTTTKVFCFLFIPFTLFAQSSLDFADTSTDRVNLGSPADLDNMATGTIICWVFPDGLATNQQFVSKRADATNALLFQENGTGGDFQFRIVRASASLTVISNTTPLSTGSWQFVAATWDGSGANGDQELFHGDLGTTVTETTYATQEVGSGAQGDDSGVEMSIGNVPDGGLGGAGAFNGRIAFVHILDTDLTVGQISAQQFKPHVTENTLVFMWVGFNGTGTQPDWSTGGSNHQGTVTGTTIAGGVPIY